MQKTQIGINLVLIQRVGVHEQKKINFTRLSSLPVSLNHNLEKKALDEQHLFCC